MTDFDDLFDAASGSPPPAAPSPADSPAKSGVENRRESRVRAKWPAKVLKPDGTVQDLRLYDLAESGVGFVADRALPAHQVLSFSIAVPDLHGTHGHTVVTGTVKIAHMTIRGMEVHFGGPWVSLPADGRKLIENWVRRLRK